ncbi:hypothetical protein GCM10009547_34730 [Sporichthya brevicatena]|uniref:BD-FAE-like domain-containing protein n=1 Tax=Sporichthya brevicatena TaxID=171442 RepID=A0ABN1H3L4_9ACTN
MRQAWVAVIALATALSLLVGSDDSPAAAGETAPGQVVVAETVASQTSTGATDSGDSDLAAAAPEPILLPPVTAPADFGLLASKAGVRVKTHVVSEEYGNARALDVYTPRQLRGRTGQARPTIVLVHGGGWVKGDRTDLEKQAVQLTQLGYVVVSVNYRLAQHGTAAEQREDVQAAIAYVRKNASRLNVDPKRMVLIGSSAGGQIAASVATAGTGPNRFRGLVTLSGLLDPFYMVGTNPDYSGGVVPNLLLRCLPIECPDEYRAAAAVNQLDRTDPPSLLFHSAKEQSWGPEQAQAFQRAAHAVGVDSRLVVLPGRKHGIALWNQIFPVLRDWLAERV